MIEAARQRSGPTEAREWHVQRELNIRAGTAAHRRYFGYADRATFRYGDFVAVRGARF